MGFISDILEPFGLGPGVGQAAGQAAGVQARAAGSGIEELRRQFGSFTDLQQPGIEAGGLARQQQLALLGLLGPEAQQAAQAAIQEGPGQKFIRERQQRALLRSGAATGQLGGGRIQTALQQQAAGFAQQDLQNQFGRLGVLSGAGQQAIGQVGQFGQATAQGIAGLFGQQGAATASGILGKQQARAQGLGNLISLGGAIFSDKRLKTNIKKVKSFGKINVYEWNWTDTGTKDVGFIAQQVREVFPEFVFEKDGYLMVDYNRVLEAA